MKVIVLGNGFLGTKFSMRGYEVWGRDKFTVQEYTNLRFLDRYDVIINCIAKSNTRWCEKSANFQEALWSNGEVPRLLSEYCTIHNKQFVHISTGCLYDNGAQDQSEDGHLVAHLNYTVTKWVGEQGCIGDDLILRPRLLFGDHWSRNNLLCKLPNFTRFVSEVNSYTSTDVVVNAVEHLLKAKQSGVFNVACGGNAMVLELAQWLGLKGEPITGRQLQEQEYLYLVNNTMSISKLWDYYQPPKLKDEILRCWGVLGV